MLTGARTYRRGFTLIEMIVSVGIFAIVMTVALGVLLAVSQADRKAETMKSIMDNLNFSLESMTRAIRTGRSYSCGESLSGGDCAASGNQAFSFIDVNGNTVTYRFSTTACANGVGCIERRIGSGSWAAMTSPDVIISSMRFYLIGSGAGDLTQPKMTVLLSGYVQVSDSQRSTFAVQTSATQRLYDQ